MTISKNMREKGNRGEALAVQFLEKKLYKIVHRNWHCRWGEIDIIADDSGMLVFVEVKSAGSKKFGNPIERVDIRKQRRIIKTAMQYILENYTEEVPLRFDVIAIDMSDSTICHIPDAFAVEEEMQ